MEPVVLVDGRWLEPPEPMERVLPALNDLRPGQTLRFLIHREPTPLYALLRDRGLHHVVRPIGEGCFEVLITHPHTPS
ncbi:MAG TPA: DUF2249 domain-containing protein [Thiobacillaceae bacterium]|nr:DUF2249 domain-containing protein [Thiobacillaceae bacterium]HNU62905.1 DUF2249 domain-containing protein [Thiobacillaceae bacterium]